MGLKVILAAGGVAFVIFLVLSYAYGFVKAGDAEAKIRELATSFGSYSPELSQAPATVAQYKPLIAFGEVYLMTLRASFTSLGRSVDALAGAVQGLVSQLTAGAGGLASLFTGGLTQMITGLVDAFLPTPLFFYLFAVISGFAAGFLFLKTFNLKETLILPITPAIILTIIVAVISMLFLNPYLAQAAASAPAMPGVSAPAPVSPADYLLVFIFTYLFFAVGAFAAAGLRHALSKRAASVAESA